MLELVVVDGRARGIVTRDMVTGALETHLADAVVLATGGYGNVFYLATYAKGCNGTAIWRAYKKGAAFANPCYTQIHPTCIPVHGDYQSKLTLMSESLRNDGRIWVPKQAGRHAPAAPDPRGRARLLPGAQVPDLRQPRPARHLLARRQAGVRRRAAAWARAASASTSTSRTRSSGSAPRRSARSTATCSRCTSASPTRTPTRRRCASTRPRTTRWAGCGWTTT